MWLKIKIWTKVILVSAIVIYCALFLWNNQTTVKFWYWIGRTYESSLVTLLLSTFVVGILSTLLVRTTWRTYRQIKGMRERSRVSKMEREMADMKSKAAMVRTRPIAGGHMETPNNAES